MAENEVATFDEQGDMVPPWIKYPGVPFGSIGWRMGYPEAYIEEFVVWHQALTARAQAALRKKYPGPGQWQGFYFRRSPAPEGYPASLQRRAMAGIYGALVGDAFGVPFEFKAAEHIPALRDVQMAMPASFDKTYSAIPYGTWSDDGAQPLCLLEALHGGSWFYFALLHELPEALGGLLLRWARQAHHQSGGVVFDCGGQTHRALELIRQGTPALRAGGTELHSNGNGSLMRVLPVAVGALRRSWGLEEVAQLAHLQSRVTHAHPLAQVCCACYCLTAIYLCKEQSRASVQECFQLARDALAEIYAAEGWTEHSAALKEIGDYPKTRFCRGSGYVVDTLWTAMDCADKSDSYADAVRRAVSYGNDTDTTACVAGGLAGMKYGFAGNGAPFAASGIPADWIAMLRMPPESAALLQAVFGELPGGNQPAATPAG